MKNNSPNSPEVDAILRAVRAFKSQSALARAINCQINDPENPNKIKQGHVWHWMHRSGRVPSQYAMTIQTITAKKGAVVTVHELRPDVFGIATSLQLPHSVAKNK